MRRIVNAAVSAALCAVAVCCAPSDVHKRVVPLPAGYGPQEMSDVCVPAVFSVSDFDWVSGDLTMTVYNEDLYDMVDIHNLSVGDTLFYDGADVVAREISRVDGGIDINGGIGQENGASLSPYEGGTWRAVQFDDHSIYSKVDKVTMPLSGDFRIVDCGQMYESPSDTVTSGQRQYLDGLTGSRRDFSFLNTKVLVEGGKITGIVRRWIP